MEPTSYTYQSAMGGVKYGELSKFNVNPGNPASYSAIRKPTFSAGINFRTIAALQDTLDQTASTVFFRYFSMTFPLTKFMSASFGIMPLSSMGYNLKQTGTSASGEKYTTSYSGNGNISRVYFGTGIALLKDSANVLSLGVNGSYLFGTLERNQKILSEFGSGTYNIRKSNRTMLSDFNLDAGLIYQRRITKNLVGSF